MKRYLKIKLTATVFLAALLLVACTKQDTGMGPSPQNPRTPLEVNIALEVPTRSIVTGAEFTHGQHINVILKDAGPTTVYQGIAMQYKYNKLNEGTPGMWTPTETEGLLVSELANVYAHYPATLPNAQAHINSTQDSLILRIPQNLDLGTVGVSNTYESFYMAVDNTKPTEKKEIFSSKADIDYMTGNGTQVGTLQPAVKNTTIIMEHAMAMVVVYVYRHPDMPNKPNVEEISITNVAGGTEPLRHGAVSLLTNGFMPSLDLTASYTRTMSGFPIDNVRYAMLVYPATMESGDVEMGLTVDQIKYTIPMPAKTWKPGHVYIYNVKVLPNSASLEDVKLLDWPAWTEKDLILE